MRCKALLVLFVIFIMAAQPVSAGFVEDLFSNFFRTTGNVISAFEGVDDGSGGDDAPPADDGSGDDAPPADDGSGDDAPPADDGGGGGGDDAPPADDGSGDDAPPDSDSDPVPDVHCETFVDDAGCTVKKCDDGFYEINCPEMPPRPGPDVHCEDYVDEDGCDVKKCDDGFFEKHCDRRPLPPQCDTFRDPAGCTVTKCTDGFYEQKCPDEPEPWDGDGPRPPEPPVPPESDNYLIPGPEREKCENEGGMVTFAPNGRQVCIYPQEDVDYDGRIQQCERFIDDKGMMRVECWDEEGYEDPWDENCPSIEELQKVKQKCKENEGMAIERTDHRGCTFFDCEFKGEGEGGDFFRPGECPSQEEIDRMAEKCEHLGMPATIVKDGSCLVTKCIGKEGPVPPDSWRRICAEEEDPAFRKRIKDECFEKGGEPFQRFDDLGCPITVCDEGSGFEDDHCNEKPPMEAYMRCEDGGGELIVKTDPRGCVEFTKCVMRGDKNRILYDDVYVDEIPSAARLLSIAMKLEDLRIEFDKLARKTESIAQYYDSVGDETEAARFYKVSGMFEAAKDKVDQIKAKLRERVRDIRPEDLMEIKHDIKYISEVIMEDALYVMLSTGEDFGDYGDYGDEAEGNNCYSDERCFDSHLRVCEEGTTFNPDPAVIVTIEGMDGKNCVLHVVGDDGGEMQEMKCYYPDYAFGAGDQILDYCEGPLKDILLEQEGGSGDNRPPVYEGRGDYDQEERWKNEEGGYGQGEYGIEYGRLGCNDLKGYQRAKEGCRYACEIKVPGCEPWIVCADGPQSCPPGNYCELHPESCPEKGDDFRMCSDDDEWAMKECSRRGGKPQSDPKPGEGCEHYTGCLMPGQNEEPEEPVVESIGWCAEEDENRFECMNLNGVPQGKLDLERGCEVYVDCEIQER